MSTLGVSEPEAARGGDGLAARYRSVRSRSLSLAEPLSDEDMAVQAEECASPTKWHLAHTTWFFETLALRGHEPEFRWHDERFPFLFNSYYNTLGDRQPRARRGVVTRPGVAEVLAYRERVDERVLALLESGRDAAQVAPIIEIGLHHEQQHQELLLTDIKLTLSGNPLLPAYDESSVPAGEGEAAPELGWVEFDGGVVEIGHGGEGFAYDNEGPRHRRFLEPYALADRMVTNGEYLAFMEDGGYENPAHWLDEGWTRAQREGWRRPMYWVRGEGGEWKEFTLGGVRPLDPGLPASHLSFFEADAYARWAGARLPTEVEWEHASEGVGLGGQFVESGVLHPQRAGGGEGLRQVMGGLWEWTRSAHEPYPGYAAPEGPLGEYNGKFMCGTFVLRGGSYATSESHVRRTYRNFFEPGARWQCAGVRLARSRR